MNDGEALGNAADRLCSGFRTRLPAEVWEAPITSGKALEWATVAAIGGAVKPMGWDLAWSASPPERFAMRNDIPMHHGAKPGHSAGEQLELRFVEGFTPKLVLSRDSQTVSVFREGCAYHRVTAPNNVYMDRPDLLLVAGQPLEGLPRLVHDDTALEAGYAGPTGEVHFSVAVLNAVTPVVLTGPKINGGWSFAPIGLVECSIDKRAPQLTRQISRYRQVFGRPDLPAVAVTGNRNTPQGFAQATVDLSGDVDSLVLDLTHGAELCIRAFGLS